MPQPRTVNPPEIELRGKVNIDLLRKCREAFPAAANDIQAVRALLQREFGARPKRR